jgi:hypothetical protein
MRILCLKQGITDTDTFNKGIVLATQSCATIGLTLEFNFTDTTRVFTSIPVVNNIILNGYVVNPADIMDEAKKITLLKPFDAQILIYDWTKITPQPTNPSDGGSAISIPCQWFNSPETFCTIFLHELSHYFSAYFNVFDNTHLMFDPKWNGQFSQKSQDFYYLFLLKPLVERYNAIVKPKNAPDAVLVRNIDNGTETLGTLQVGQVFQCRTLERSYKNNLPNISSILIGTYTCSWKWMWRELRYRYQVMNVPNRTGVFLHQGNYFFESAGCIILGSQPQDINGDSQLDLINTKTILDYFEQLMGHKDFQILIK